MLVLLLPLNARITSLRIELSGKLSSGDTHAQLLEGRYDLWISLPTITSGSNYPQGS
jgi:hypothetical protein